MRLMFPLRLFHVIESDEANAHDLDGIQAIGGWADRHVTSLDEFLEAVFIVLRKGKERGAVGLKDQSAYSRSLSYDLVPRCDAERLFNRLLTDPRNALGWPEAKPLDDFLFHQYMRFARELDLPVQLHTGHMAGIWNRVDKADAGLLTQVLELHQGVRFDLFHGNWPEMGPLLFLGKNYPNVALDLLAADHRPALRRGVAAARRRDDPDHQNPRLRRRLCGCARIQRRTSDHRPRGDRLRAGRSG